MESSEINKYHNKDIIDRLETLETKWELLPDDDMYTDILEKYEEILKKYAEIMVELSHYLKKDADDTVSSVITFEQMPIIPDAEKDEDIIKKKHLNVVSEKFVRNDEQQTLDNEFIFRGHVAVLDPPNNDWDVARYLEISELEKSKLTKTFSALTQTVEPDVTFNGLVTFKESPSFPSLVSIKFSGKTPTFNDGGGESNLLTEKAWEAQRYSLLKFPEIQGLLLDPTEDQQLVHKKYVDDQIKEHELPDDIVREGEMNTFTNRNSFYGETYINNVISIMSLRNSDVKLRQAGYNTESGYFFIEPGTYNQGDYLYSDYINEYYYRVHTLIKDSNVLQKVSSSIDFTGRLFKEGKEFKSLTPEQIDTLEKLKRIAISDNQLKFNSSTLVDENPLRKLYTSNKTNFSFSNSTPSERSYNSGVSASVLGGMYRFSSYPSYEFLGVLQEVKDTSSEGSYKDTVHLMTYSIALDSYSTPPMFNNNVGMWISGVECTGLWNSSYESLESVETVLGKVNPQQYGIKADNSMDIRPAFSKVTCIPNNKITTYESGLLYGTGHLWDNDTLNEEIAVEKCALYSKGETTHPQKSLSNSDFHGIFGLLDWNSDDRKIRYEASSFYHSTDDIFLPRDSKYNQNFHIIAKNGHINWESSTETSGIIEKELSLIGSHSANEYNFVHRLIEEKPNTNQSILNINNSIDNYDLLIHKRKDHREWYPLKIIGFDSSIALNHQDLNETDPLTVPTFDTSIKNKIGHCFVKDPSDNSAKYSRSLIQSSYLETHTCNQPDLTPITFSIKDEIELGNIHTDFINIQRPLINSFNVLQNTIDTGFTGSYLAREAISGYLIGYQGSINSSQYSTIRWNGYPASLYQQHIIDPIHQKDPLDALYFNNTTNPRNEEISSISTFCNFDSFIEYGSKFEYNFNQKQFELALLPNPAIKNEPTLNIIMPSIIEPRDDKQSIISLSATNILLKGGENPQNSEIILDAAKIIAPNLPTSKALLKPQDLVCGAIIEDVYTTLMGLYLKCQDDIEKLKEHEFVRLIQSDAPRPLVPAPQGRIITQNSYGDTPDQEYYSYPKYSRTLFKTRGDLSGAGIVTASFKITALNEISEYTPYVNDQESSLTLENYTSVDPDELIRGSNLYFDDHNKNRHLIASDETVNAFRFTNYVDTEPIPSDIHPYIEKHTTASRKIVYKLILKDRSGQELASIDFTTLK